VGDLVSLAPSGSPKKERKKTHIGRAEETCRTGRAPKGAFVEREEKELSVLTEKGRENAREGSIER